nr:MAG TPA_asm: hypothetical protein [Bacteriophage sp.]
MIFYPLCLFYIVEYFRYKYIASWHYYVTCIIFN